MTFFDRLVQTAALALLVAAAQVQAQWTAPTPEELSMTSIPQVPGAVAAYLFKEEIADDGLHMQSFYYRIKILTEGGKDLANVELPFYAGESGITLDTISGRTIHADGTIIPFTDKPYEKVVEKAQGYKIKVKVFSLPAVEVGSIIEYRYSLRLDDHWFQHPDWIIQTSLFTRKAHYMWRPTDRQLNSPDGKQVSSSVAWTPLLPPGVQIKETKLLQNFGSDAGHIQLDLDVHDILPLPKEQFMPPMQSVAYKVLFYYTSYRTSKEYWASEGKGWAKTIDKFIGPGSVVKSAVAELVGPADTPEQKLRKLYAAAMTVENTDFIRAHTTAEERAAVLKEIKSADDVWSRKRGSGDQIAALFVGMARAAGVKAYLMGVANRQERFFLPGYMNMGQLDDDIAIVNLDGKDIYLDPGERYCAFGQLAWVHAFTGGLRETEGGTEVAMTSALSYKDVHITRVADLKVDETGIGSGAVVMTYTGDAALMWRHDALRGDETSMKENLRTNLEHLLPGGMDVKVSKVENLTDYEQPLKVTYEVKGPIGSSTGKRLLVVGDLFEANSKPKFPEAKRELPIDLKYPTTTQDVVRLSLPAGMVVESSPTAASNELKGTAAYTLQVAAAPTSITIRRNLTVGKTFVGTETYDELRAFYGKYEAKDQESVVLTRSTPVAASGGN